MNGIEPLPSYATLVYAGIRVEISAWGAVYFAPYIREDYGVILECWIPGEE